MLERFVLNRSCYSYRVKIVCSHIRLFSIIKKALCVMVIYKNNSSNAFIIVNSFSCFLVCQADFYVLCIYFSHLVLTNTYEMTCIVIFTLLMRELKHIRIK